ncbi:hypothetical protein [Streptomyces canus]|uniref:hypothetical protein n=1 Tax=Streptomyces canus TaxID=58343 RepID=UPI003864D471|nr:hypothetical protein OH824_14120 [Streptomyces canus]
MTDPTARQRLLDAMRNRTCFCGADSCKTAEDYVDALVHELAEQDTSPVIALYEQWVKAGPPPLGASMARWWDMRLAELHRALTGPAEQPARTTPNNPSTSKDRL